VTDVAMDDEIREHLAGWLNGDASWEELEDWYVAASWDHDSVLIRALNALFAERELMPAEEFSECVRRSASTVWLGEARLPVASSTTVTLLRPPAEVGGDQTIRRRLVLAGT
jgi:hypothetical protein